MRSWGDDFDLLYAVALLAHLREPAAHDLLVDLSRLPTEQFELLIGGFLAEGMERALLATCEGRTERIRGLLIGLGSALSSSPREMAANHFPSSPGVERMRSARALSGSRRGCFFATARKVASRVPRWLASRAKRACVVGGRAGDEGGEGADGLVHGGAHAAGGAVHARQGRGDPLEEADGALCAQRGVGAGDLLDLGDSFPDAPDRGLGAPAEGAGAEAAGEGPAMPGRGGDLRVVSFL